MFLYSVRTRLKSLRKGQILIRMRRNEPINGVYTVVHEPFNVFFRLSCAIYGRSSLRCEQLPFYLIFAGTPMSVQLSGVFRTAAAPAPNITRVPIWICCRTFAPNPIHDSEPT